MVWILIEMHGGQIEPVYIFIILYVLIQFLQLRLPHRNNT